MTEISSTPSVIAILGVSKEPVHVPEGIITMGNTLKAILTSGDDLIETTVITTQQGRVTTLGTNQGNMKNGPADKKEQRDMSYGLCFGDHQSNMAIIQIAANDLHDPIAAAALIIRNGYGIKSQPVAPANPNISIKNKKNVSGTITAKVKSPNTNKRFSIDWDYSTDNGVTWIHSNSTAVCQREISGINSGAHVIVRARFVISYDAPMDWMISNTETVS